MLIGPQASLLLSGMSQTSSKMSEPPTPETLRGAELLPFDSTDADSTGANSTGAKTAPGIQRELQFDDSEGPEFGKTAVREGGPESNIEPLSESAPEESQEVTGESEEPFVLALETTPKGGRTEHIRHFAVALDGIARPRDIEEQKQAERAAQTWHRDLLGFLSEWTTGTEFCLRYQAAPAENRKNQRKAPLQFGISLIVTVGARSAETATARAHRIFRELRHFLRSSADGAGRMYDFTPVATEESLRQRLVPFPKGDGIRLSRRRAPLETKGGSRMGFGARHRETSEPEVPTGANAFGAERHLAHLIQAMTGHSAPSLLDVRLRPTALRAGELSCLRSLARGEVIDSTFLSGVEEEAIVAFGEGLIQARCCFEVEVTLTQRQAPVSPGLQAAAKRGFFGENGRVEAREASLEKTGELLRPADCASPVSKESQPRPGPPAENGTPVSEDRYRE
jgi:hypothetical protein